MKIPQVFINKYRQIKYPADTRRFNSVVGYFDGLSGCEIGGPTPLFAPIYSAVNGCDCVNFSSETIWTGNLNDDYIVSHERLGKQMILDGANLESINDNTYDFILSSNNLEHIANPMKAIGEWKRVIVGGGI